MCIRDRGKEIKVVIYGVGALGSRIVRALAKRKEIEFVGAITRRSNLGKDLGEVAGLDRKLGVAITNEVDKLLSEVDADIVVHTTSSYLKDVYPQLEKCIKAGLDVVSTTEELSYPYRKYPELSKSLDELAKKHGVAVLGTGINPGFLMDTLPVVLTAPCEEVKSIEVTRMMYSGNRRIPYQKKIGTGLTKEEFNRMISEGKITGHVGLYESIAMIAAALGWDIDDIVELPPEPVICTEEVTTSYTTVKVGQVAGLKSVAYATKNGEKIITLNFISHANVKEPYDEVKIEGTPNLTMRILGGVHGDIGTVSMVVNSIPKVLKADPGLYTMIDLPVPSYAVRITGKS